jgi:fatty-acid desaturase
VNSKLAGMLQVLLFFTASTSVVYLLVDFNFYYLLGAILLFKVTQTFGSGLAHHIWISHNLTNLSGVMKYFALTCLVLAGVNRPQFYSRYHTLHHRFTDTDKDPHSPVNYNALSLTLGLWVLDAHLYDKYITPQMHKISMKVLNEDTAARLVDKNYYILIFCLILVSSLLSPMLCMYFVLLPIFLNNIDGNFFFIYYFHRNGKTRNIKILNYWILGKGGDHGSHHRFFKRYAEK